jgi:glycogen debranching enzyme
MDDLKNKIHNLMLKNRRQFGEFQYTVPDPAAYPYQWLWDSCFHAIVLCQFDPADAKRELLALVNRQFNNGMIPHMIYWEKGDVIDISWGKDGTSSITQPPMIAYAVWKIYQSDNDLDFLKQIYKNLFHYYKYLLNDRDPHERHLVGIINPDESGEDNSPRFDSILGLPPVHTLEENFQKRLLLVDENKKCNFDAPFCMKNFFWVKDVPFNAILVENLHCLADIADKLGFAYDATYFRTKRLEVISAMRELMLEDGLFWSTYGAEYEKIKVKTWAFFSPLFAKMLEQTEADKLIKEHLLNPKEFWTEYPVPTVSLDDPSYDQNGFWRGPVWMATNWFVYKGLINYGYQKEAKIIQEKSLTLLEKSGFREQFNPHTAEGMGANDFTWGGLVLDMNDV